MIIRILTITALAASVASVTAQSSCPPPPPVIRCNPQWQVVQAGYSATFTVQAENPSDVHEAPWFTYQWQRQGTGGTNFDSFVDIAGATNTSYRISMASTNDDSSGPAYFRVKVSTIHDATATSLPAGLLVYPFAFTNAFPVPVYGATYYTKGVSCGGTYVGAVSYVFAPDHSNGNVLHKVADLTRTDTTLEGWDYYACFYYCGSPANCPNTHNPCDSQCGYIFNFTIYFPKSVPQTLYPIYPTGFLGTIPGCPN
jgi:hypothetical protein